MTAAEEWPEEPLEPGSPDARAALERSRAGREERARPERAEAGRAKADPGPEGPSLLDRIRTGTWLDRQAFPPLKWAIPDLIPEGFGPLVGPPKVGKSYLALDALLAVASGGLALGAIPVGPARPTLYLALEDGDRRMQARCRQLLRGEPIPGLFEYTTRARPDEVLPLLDAWLAEYGRDDPLIVLDTLGKVMPPAMPGETAYSRDYRVSGALKARTDAHPGTALAANHHTRKAESPDWMDATNGTQGLNGAADFTINVSRGRGETAGLLRVTGRDIDIENEYAATFADGSWTLDGATLAEAAQAAQQAKATAGLGDRSAEIVRMVGIHPDGIGPTALGTMLDMSPADAGKYLKRLTVAGRISQPSRGLYTPVQSVESVKNRGDVASRRLDTLDGLDTGTEEGK